MIERRTGVGERLLRREAGTSLALFRIGVGLSVLAVVVPMFITGAHELVLVDRSDGGYTTTHANWLLEWLGGPTRRGIARLLALATTCGLALTLGLGGRVTAFVTLQLCIALNGLNTDASGGANKLLVNALWLAVLGDTTRTLSLDCWIRRRRLTSDEQVAAWPRFLAVYQLVVMYTVTGLQKLAGVAWTPWGDLAAVYQVLLQPSYRRLDMQWIAPLYPLLQLASVLTLIFEIGAGVWLLAAWYRDTRERPGRLRALFNRLDVRLIWALMGITMHSLISLFMNVGPFTLVTLSFYACLWHPGAWHRLVRPRPGVAA